ncbi:protein phosphatase 2C domain-containing protein [Hymenobacter metallilatus]|uniref:PPM-type phosphatase domain-containing protein n=1 Tax=Hymenobacter metallilatus TaxID=2493666 RepID=A0A428IYK8_9BACT|nr:protein phosphatase 2C domain-containing protein [Hymenobacter metallilatus]RSK24151.1 hypothetical protein EI290_20420 [Hymenobacter metallilatus]
MQIDQFLKRGAYHPTFCEDFSLVQPLEPHKLVLAVMDGCTMGQESHFAATLLAKILRKVLKEWPYRAIYDPDLQHLSLQRELQALLAALFTDVQQLKNQLLLSTAELLATLVLALLDTRTGEVAVLALGDATVAINGQLTRFEQDNRPDYLAYHLGQPFETWYNRQQQRLHHTMCVDLALATDGIDSFQPLVPTEGLPDVPTYLLLDQRRTGQPEVLNRKVRQLEKEFSLVPTDDVAILRVQLA